ncbi:MAG: PAS domain-containing protein, partial [Pseudomonadota bacterium]|nr:PAS domain-containing protein [Pseudomonadota bacterium]
MPTDRTQDRKVVNMTQFASSARFQPIKEVEAYWQAIRAGRLVPRRSDIDPRGIERALEFAFVAERIATGLGRLRIAGSHLTDLLGMEVRGMPLTAFFA